MKCKQCSAPIPKDAVVCPACQAPVPEKKKLFSLKGLLIGAGAAVLILAVLLLVGLFRFGQGKRSFRYQGRGYSSSEEAARAYIEAFRSQDVSKILSTTCLDHYADNNILVNYVSIIKGSIAPFASSTDYMEKITRAGQSVYFTNSIFKSYLQVCSTLKGTEDSIRGLPNFSVKQSKVPTANGPYDVSSEDLCSDLAAYLSDPAITNAISNLQICGFIPIDWRHYDAFDDEDDYTELIQINAGRYRASNYQTCVAQVRIGGEMFYFCVDTVCLNGRWYATVSNFHDLFIPDDAYPVLHS